MKVKVNRVGEGGGPRWADDLRFWVWVVLAAFAVGVVLTTLVLFGLLVVAIVGIVIAAAILAVWLASVRQKLNQWWHGRRAK